MNVCMDGWMGEWMDGWMDGWMDVGEGAGGLSSSHPAAALSPFVFRKWEENSKFKTAHAPFSSSSPPYTRSPAAA